MSRSIDIVLTPLPEAPRAAPERPVPVMPQACSSGGCGGSPAPPRPPAPSFEPVLVDGEEIAPELIAHEMQHHPAPDAETSWRAAARALVLRELLLREARRLGVETDAGGEDEAEDEALVRRLLEHRVQPEAAGEAACRRVYDADPRRFRTPDLFEASHILIEPEGNDEAAWRAAQDRARGIALEVRDDREAFAQAARAWSRCPSAHQDGSLGQVRRGDLVEAVQRALEALAPGTTGREPVRSRFGWHVLRLERRIDGQVLPFEIVRPRIADMLEARAWTTASVGYLASLVSAARIEGIDLEPGMAACGAAR